MIENNNKYPCSHRAVLSYFNICFFRVYTDKWNCQVWGSCLFNFPNCCQIVFKSDDAVLHSLTHYMNVSISTLLTNAWYSCIVNFNQSKYHIPEVLLHSSVITEVEHVFRARCLFSLREMCVCILPLFFYLIRKLVFLFVCFLIL